jgi:thiamine transporter
MEMFAKLAEITIPVWLTIAALVVLAVALLVTAAKTKWTARMLAVGAICLAASFVLSYMRLFKMPQGGSITVMSMLPVMLFAYLYGVGPGLVCGLAFGILQFIQEPYFYTVPQFALDYLVAFAVLGFAALGAKLPGKDIVKLPIGVALGGLLRTISSFLSGYLFFAEYAPEGMHPAVYSLVYNFSSIGVDTLVCIVGAVLLAGTGILTMLKKSAAQHR